MVPCLAVQPQDAPLWAGDVTPATFMGTSEPSDVNRYGLVKYVVRYMAARWAGVANGERNRVVESYSRKSGPITLTGIPVSKTWTSLGRAAMDERAFSVNFWNGLAAWIAA